MTTKKLELRIDLGDSIVPSPTPNSGRQSTRKPGDTAIRIASNRGRSSRAESSARASAKSPYNSVLGPAGSNISGVSIVNPVNGNDSVKKDGRTRFSELLRSRGKKKPELKYQEPKQEPLITARNETFTPFNSTKDLDIGKRPLYTPANTAITLITPLRGSVDSPLKPYKRQFASAIPRAKHQPRNTIHEIPATAPTMGKRDQQTSKRVRIKGKKDIVNHDKEKKVQGSPSGMVALRDLFDAVDKGTSNLTFKQMLEVKVAVGMASHIPRESIEDMTSLQSILDELSLLWKINRMDVDLLEYLLQKIGLYDKFSSVILKYKELVDYDVLTGSSERDVTTIIATLHNLLQGSEDATAAYTTISFSHYGDVYSFMRERLSCMKRDLAKWLGIHYTQITYIAKLSSSGEGYVTVMQLPCSVTKKIVNGARKNHPALMSLGIKGVQITGSDGLKYTQSMGYLQEKDSEEARTELDMRAAAARSARTAPAGPSLPPLTQKQKDRRRLPHTSMAQHGEITTPRSQRRNQSQLRQLEEAIIPEEEEIVFPNFEPPNPIAKDLSLLPQPDPDEAKFERRVRLARETLTKLTKPENEELVGVLLDQIQKLQRLIVTLKKDLREKTRDLNTSQSYVHRAQREMKSIEMRVESKAQEISQTNEHLLQRVKKQMRENARLRELLEGKEAELEMHRQSNKDNRLTGMMRIARVSRVPTLPQPISFG